MSTLAAQVVEQLKTDMDNVYDAGYQKGKSEGGGEDLLQYATNLHRLFHGAKFPTGTELNINAPYLVETMQQFMYYCTGVSKLILKGNINDKSLHMERSFGGTDLEVIDFTEFSNGIVKPRYMTGMFASSKKLHTILGVLDLSNVINSSNQGYPFDACSALVEVRFAPNSILYNLPLNYCKLLSDESIQSIIDGLADLTGQTAQTIAFHADVKARLTEEQIATITSKNWTLA